jgi:hypothetical protein
MLLYMAIVIIYIYMNSIILKHITMGKYKKCVSRFFALTCIIQLFHDLNVSSCIVDHCVKTK